MAEFSEIQNQVGTIFAQPQAGVLSTFVETTSESIAIP